MTLIKPALELIAFGGGMFVLFYLFRHRPPLDNVTPAKEREIKVDFDKRRDTESKRINSLERDELLAELNRDRSQK